MKRPIRISQFVAGFSAGDAISNYSLEIDDILRSWPGVSTEIYSVSRHISRISRDVCKDFRHHREDACEQDVSIYHFSIGSEISEYFRQIPDRKVLIYHNITPAHYYRGISEERVRFLMEGREEMKTLADVPEVSLAVSGYNRNELEAAGFRDPQVIPLVVNFQYLATKPARGILRKYRDGWTNILFVGRMVPNKKFEDLIRVFYYYKRCVNSASRLLLVGSYAGLDRYLAYLRGMTAELALPDVVFTGHVELDELLAFYRSADVFLCMSEHEGFCIPLIEAMHFDVPVLACEAAAVPETLGGAGVLFRQRRYREIAELIDVVARDEKTKEAVQARQQERLKDFNRSVLEKRLEEVLLPLLKDSSDHAT